MTDRKSSVEAAALGKAIKLRRQSQLLTLKNIALRTGVDVGQLSRFERGDFRFVSTNLQKVMEYLQIQASSECADSDLVQRFSTLVARSARHEAAARALILALESLQ